MLGAFPVGRARDRGWKCVLPAGQNRAEFKVQSSFLTGDLLPHLPGSASSVSWEAVQCAKKVHPSVLLLFLLPSIWQQWGPPPFGEALFS